VPVEVDEEGNIAFQAYTLKHLLHMKDGRMKDFGRGLPSSVEVGTGESRAVVAKNHPVGVQHWNHLKNKVGA